MVSTGRWLEISPFAKPDNYSVPCLGEKRQRKRKSKKKGKKGKRMEGERVEREKDKVRFDRRVSGRGRKLTLFLRSFCCSLIPGWTI